jgi:hypothetical protein
MKLWESLLGRIKMGTVLQASMTESEIRRAAGKQSLIDVLDVLSAYGDLSKASNKTADAQAKSDRRKAYYQNTREAMENYRSLVWRLEEAAEDIEDELREIDGGSLKNLSALIDAVDTTNCGPDVYSQDKANNHKRMIGHIKYINYCMAKLKNRPAQIVAQRKARITSEQLYNSLFYSFIDPNCLRPDEIAELLGVGRRTYYRWVEEGIEQLGEIMWGSSSPMVNKVVDLFNCISQMQENGELEA